MPPYVVGGFILGPILPARSLSMRNVEIRYRRKDEHYPRNRPTRPNVSFQTTDAGAAVNYVSISPGDLSVQSEWVIIFRVTVADEESALELVRQTLLPQTLASLELMSGTRYQVEIVRIVEDWAGGKSVSPFSEFATGHIEHVEPLSSEAEAFLLKVASTLHDDALASEVSTLLGDAAELFDSSGGHARILRAAVLATFQGMERIAQVVSKSAELDIDRELLERVEETRAVLASSTRTVSAKVAEIRRSYADINRIMRASGRGQIIAAGSVLRLSKDQVDEALRFLRFRNQSLGHAGLVIQPAALHEWFGRGRGILLEFLLAYVNWAAPGS
jgi:hypothetical protein